MKYILVRNGQYTYVRRVPELVREFDTRNRIRISLKTDSKDVARARAITLNNTIEAYWRDLMIKGETYEEKRFKQAVRIAQQMGFSYLTTSEIVSKNSLEALQDRLDAISLQSPKQVEALLGAVPIPKLKLSNALEKFWVYTKDRILNKSSDQVRKWENPRKKAINNFVGLIGDKELSNITREDLIAFRDWWIGRIEDDEDAKKQGSANKDFGHLKDVLETVSENLKLNLPIEYLFKKIAFRDVVESSRPPFTKEQILAILHSSKIEKLNREAKWFLFAMAETGARNSEILGLLPEEIHLNAPIPFIQIKPRKGKGLKTKHSIREVPLVGYALEAFKAMPNGFSHYRDKPDNLTNYLNRFLRENDLLPTEKHTVYSLRHSFQDRILSVNTPDRIQAELMGHKFSRPKYGEGGTLQQKKEWLAMVCLKEGWLGLAS